MASLRSCVVAATCIVSFLSLSCGGGSSRPGGPSSSWVAPALLGHVPADSPYLFASLEPANDKIRQRMFAGYQQQATELMRKFERARDVDRATLEPWMRAVFAIGDELRGKDPSTWAETFGFDSKARFAIYGLSIWPVARVEVANPARLRALIDRALSAGGVQLKQQTLEGHAYWVAGSERFSLVAAVLEHEAVVAVLPTPALPTSLPLVLGIKKPADSLATAATVPDLLGRHHLLGFVLGYVDARKALDIVTRQTPSELDAPLHALTGPISPVCRTDLERLVALAPRLVSGYRRLDEAGFDVVGLVETPASVARGLSELRASVPEVTAKSAGNPLFAFGSAVRPEALIAWLRGVTTELHDHPFACPWLAALNKAGAELAGNLASPLPPEMQGLRGVAVVVDQATIIPPGVDGHVIVAGDHVPALLTMLAGKLPGLGAIAIKPDGQPVALPTQQLGIPLPSAHIAMTSDRLVIAAGTDSAKRATAHVATPAPPSSPLFMMAVDMPRLQKLLSSLGRAELDQFNYLGNVGMTFDIADDGIGFDVWGTWGAPQPAQPMTQP